MSFRDWIADVISGGRITACKRHNAFLVDLLRAYEREADAAGGPKEDDK